MSVPNIITLIRILLTPLLIYLLLDHRIGQALIVFFIAGVTDALDGLIARLFDQKSKLGAYLDPLADKLLLGSSFLLLGYLGLIPKWLVVIAVSRDVIISLGVVTMLLHQVPLEINPSFLSKLTTLVQIVTVCASLSSFYFSVPFFFNSILYGLTGTLCLISCLHYIFLGIRILEYHRVHNKENG
jgi:cardiolipin synthase